jgi:hypothetical protein
VIVDPLAEDAVHVTVIEVGDFAAATGVVGVDGTVTISRPLLVTAVVVLE